MQMGGRKAIQNLVMANSVGRIVSVQGKEDGLN